MDTLIDQFGLEQTGRFRGVVNSDDVLAILHHHWVICNDYYPEERQRLQHAIMDIFCSSTTARAGTIVESSCYFGRNEAVEYRDIGRETGANLETPFSARGAVSTINSRFTFLSRTMLAERHDGDPEKAEFEFCIASLKGPPHPSLEKGLPAASKPPKLV
jgi:hypothetical protein